MIELRTLGALDLRNGDGVELRSVLVQPKRTAILAYLAVAGPRGFHRRDALLALFWPEQDAPHARSALRQALHGLRQALGEDVLISRGDEEVGLDATRSRCDVLEFERALGAGDLERAVGLYRGPFLGGFFLDGAPEFERWVETERDRLSRAFANALEELAHAAEKQGDVPAAVKWWGRLAGHSPHASRVAVRLMQALDATGDRAGAIRHADQHAGRLRADLDAEPDPEVEALAEQLRSQPSRREPQPIAPTGPVSVPSRVPDVAPAPKLRFVTRRPALVAGLVLLALAGWWVISAVRASARPLHRLAVLPLANQTGDSAQQYLVEGVHEAVITELAQISGLSVISRSSVMRYQGSTMAVPEIARELKGVDAIVEGAVFRAEDSIRVTLQLIDAHRDRHLWARTFEGDLRHVLSLSHEAARAIARGARVVLTPGEVARLADQRPVNPEATAAYLRARWQFNTNTGEGLLRSIAFYRQAIALDSAYSAAWAGLADAYVIQGHEYGAPPDAFPRGRATALKALELDEEQGDAYMVLGHVAFEYDWDWAEAEHLLRRAIELNPSNARAHFISGGFLVTMSRFAEAEREMRLASQLDPLSPAVVAGAAFPVRFAGRYAEAETILRSALEVFPDDYEIQQTLGITHALQGGYAEAIAELERAQAPLGLRGWVYGRAGRRDSALAMRRQLDQRARRGPVSPWQFVLAYLGLDDRERALDYLELAYRERWREMAWLNVYPYVDSLRDHPRFQALVARMKFPQ